MVNQQNLKAALATTPECLPVEQLGALTGEQAQTHPHVSNCIRCQSELALLRAFESDQPIADEGAAVAWISAQLEKRIAGIPNAKTDKPPISWWRRWNLSVLVPAAALTAIVAVTMVVLQQRKQPELRADAAGSMVYRSEELQLVRPSGELSEAPKDLEWKNFPEASKYRVTVMEVDRNPLWTADTADFKIAVPHEVRAKMLPGKTVLWQVTALDSRGRVLATSQAERIVVSRASPTAPHTSSSR